MLQNGPEKKTFATILQKNGYTTFYSGKYLNQYGDESVGGTSHVPPGWNWWIGLKGNSRYYDYKLSVNGSLVHHQDNPEKDYFTKVIHGYAKQFLEKRPKDKPFFMMLSTPAAHAPFTPQPKYSHNFENMTAPRTKNFNIKNKLKHWLLRLGVQPLPDKDIDKIDEVYRNRLRTLLTVDDMIEDIFNYVKNEELLDQTYIIFASDNGYHLGQFSLPIDKREPYEFDSRVPFIIRGPGISSGVVSDFLTSNIDLAPTILDFAGLEIPRHMNGLSLKDILTGKIKPKQYENSIYSDSDRSFSRNLVLIEHSGEGKEVNKGCEYLGPNLSGCNPEFSCKCEDSSNNTYKCLRVADEEHNNLYCLWDDDELFEEIYDLNSDPNQIDNLINHVDKVKCQTFQTTLATVAKCYGESCTKKYEFP